MKYYAIRKGKRTGIFNSWDETKKYVLGYPGAEYKSFSDEKTAREYLLPSPTKLLSTERILIYTDGSSKNTEGGYGVVFFENGEISSFSGKVPGKATNQRAELYAVYKALSLLQGKPADLYTDSKYVIGCCTEWCYNWKENGWKNSKGETISNKDLIFDILVLLNDLDVEFYHVFGHTGNPQNELADQLAEKGRLSS